METYTDNAALQRCACAIMARMVTLAPNADNFVKGHGLRMLCRSLRKFPDNEGIRTWATHCLDALMKYDAHRHQVLAVWMRCSEEKTNGQEGAGSMPLADGNRRAAAMASKGDTE